MREAVGTLSSKNHIKIIDGMKPASVSLKLNSCLAYVVNVPTTSTKPMMKKPNSTGNALDKGVEELCTIMLFELLLKVLTSRVSKVGKIVVIKTAGAVKVENIFPGVCFYEELCYFCG